jgi:hypothetical protein
MSASVINASFGTRKASFSLASLLAALFTVELRETLDAATGGDKSDAAWNWGL